MADASAFIASVRRSVRKSLFQRFAPLALGQDETNRMVATVSSAAVRVAAVADLAAVAAATGPLKAALAAVAPEDPALAAFADATSGVSPDVMELVDLGA